MTGGLPVNLDAVTQSCGDLQRQSAGYPVGAYRCQAAGKVEHRRLAHPLNQRAQDGSGEASDLGDKVAT